MIIDLPDTTTRDINRRLVEERDEGGAVALGRVLTLVIDAGAHDPEDTAEASRYRVPDSRRNAAGSNSSPGAGSTAARTSGSASAARDWRTPSQTESRVRGSAWIAASGAGPPRSRHWENNGITASSSGTGGASGTCEEASAGSRISIRCSGEATAFLVGAHQATTCDFARVVAT